MEEKKKANIFDRLTDTSKYTGAHKERFNADGTGKGIAGRVDATGPKNLANMVDSKSDTKTSLGSGVKATPSVKTTTTTKTTAPVTATKTATKTATTKSDTKEVTSKMAEVKVTGTTSASTTKPKGNIFDRLTDTSKYTGAHKERFNADGSGKGKAGRDGVYDPKDLSNMVKKK